MTKSARILELYAEGKSTTEIANIVGCRQEYVRVVARQRKGTGKSESDRRYCSSPLGRKAQQRSNAKKRSLLNVASAAYQRALSQSGDIEAARVARRTARRLALLNGKSTSEADRIGVGARRSVLSRTGNREAAREASRLAYRDARSKGLATC